MSSVPNRTLALVLLFFSLGCNITDYPVITDDRGSYSGVIRTGHKAYIQPGRFGQMATVWDDGSDELFSMVYQNQYGDQKLYTFNNYDPTASVIFLDQTYCDWRYDNCLTIMSWNPANDAIDDVFDYDELDFTCSGARSLSILVSYATRYGECGDAGWRNNQSAMAEFANLATTTWRGKTAYLVPVDSATTSVLLNGQPAPIYGHYSFFITDKLQLVLPMTPNGRHQLTWLQNWIAENGPEAEVTLTYGSLVSNYHVKFHEAGIASNLTRF